MVDDEIVVFKKQGAWPDDSKWMRGKSQRTGKEGNFPGNYTEMIREVEPAPPPLPQLPPKPGAKPLPPKPVPKPTSLSSKPPVTSPQQAAAPPVVGRKPPVRSSSRAGQEGPRPPRPVARTPSSAGSIGSGSGIASPTGPPISPTARWPPTSPPPTSSPPVEQHQLRDVHVNKPQWCRHCKCSHPQCTCTSK